MSDAVDPREARLWELVDQGDGPVATCADEAIRKGYHLDEIVAYLIDVDGRATARWDPVGVAIARLRDQGATDDDEEVLALRDPAPDRVDGSEWVRVVAEYRDLCQLVFFRFTTGDEVRTNVRVQKAEKPS